MGEALGDPLSRVPVHPVSVTTARAVGGMLIFTGRDAAAFSGSAVINAPVVTMTTDARAGEPVLG